MTTATKTSEKVDDQILVDVVGAAQRLNLSPRAVQNLVYSGELPSLLIRRSRRIRVVDLEAFVVERLMRGQA